MIKHLLNDTAVVKSVSSVNEYDEYTFSEPKNIKCNIEFKGLPKKYGILNAIK